MSPIANAQSKWSGASAGDVAALQDGSVLEEVHDIKLAASFTTVEQKNALNKAYVDRGAYLAAQPFRLQYNGIFYDSSTGWSA